MERNWVSFTGFDFSHSVGCNFVLLAFVYLCSNLITLAPDAWDFFHIQAHLSLSMTVLKTCGRFQLHSGGGHTFQLSLDY